jgi:hypothetical protein
MPTPADLFRAMADRIDLVKPEEFAGAVLIVPPTVDIQGLPEPIEVLVVEAVPNPDHFWGSVKARVEVATGQVQEIALARSRGLGFR